MRWLALVVVLAGPAQAGNHIPTPFPDGSDSIGIPDEPYAGTCFVREDAVPGQVVECTAAQRVVPDRTRTSIVLPIDCATHARHTTAEHRLGLRERMEARSRSTKRPVICPRPQQARPRLG